MLTDCCESEPIALVLVFRVGRVVLFSMMAVVWNCPAAKPSIAHVVRVARPPTNKHTTVYSCCLLLFFFLDDWIIFSSFPFRFLHFPPFCFVFLFQQGNSWLGYLYRPHCEWIYSTASESPVGYARLQVQQQQQQQLHDNNNRIEQILSPFAMELIRFNKFRD